MIRLGGSVKKARFLHKCLCSHFLVVIWSILAALTKKLSDLYQHTSLNHVTISNAS